MEVYFFPLASFVLCLTSTPVIRHVAREKGWMATPNTERWHKKPTALLGGIAIYLGIAIPLLFLSDFTTLIPSILKNQNHSHLPSIAAVIWICATCLFILGLIDDFFSIKPQTKLVVQFLVASFVGFLGFRLHWFTSLTLDTMVTLVWIVGITNAFNLIDNMDGLCAGVGLIAAVCLGYLFQNSFFTEGLHVSLMIGGALAAFLIFNFKPASIFMGDSGSLVIGFSLAMLTLYSSETVGADALSLYAVPILVLLVPIFDTILVSAIRILSGRKASVGGKDHASHRLVLMGLNERNAVISLYAIGLVSGLSAIFVARTDSLTSPVVIAPVLISLLLMGIYLAQLRVYPEKEFSLLRDKPYTPVLIEITYKKQILLVVLDFGMISFAYYLSYRLRFDSPDFIFYFKIFLKSLPAIIACKMTIFFLFGIYRSMWGYMSSNDVFVYIKASTVASLLSVAAVTFIFRFKDFSKGIVIIDWLLTTGYLLASRGSFKLFIDTMKRKTIGGEKTIIYGAGRGGELLLREILNNKALRIHPVGFIDDDVKKSGKKIQGYPIMGKFSDIQDLCKKHHIRSIIVSFRNDNAAHIKKIQKFCRGNDLSLKNFSIRLEEIEDS